MTAPAVEKYDADTSPDDFLIADEPPELPETGDVPAGEGEAPYGWTRDRATGELRPKKSPGRPKTPPAADDLKAGPAVSRADDRPPEAPRRHLLSDWLGQGDGPGPAADDAPMPKGGVIAAGVNKLYRRAGKILRVFDPEMGAAFIACTYADTGDDADELTVGEAWENLCKTNPRVRRVILKAIAGGAVGDLFMAHAPIGIAFMMKPLVQKLIPFERLISSVAEPDDDTPEGEGGLPGGMTEADFGDMQAMAEQQARRMAERMGMNVSPEDLAAASAAAAEKMPPAFRRQQPRGQTRQQRRKAGAR
jgi:hypothetical protein